MRPSQGLAVLLVATILKIEKSNCSVLKKLSSMLHDLFIPGQ